MFNNFDTGTSCVHGENTVYVSEIMNNNEL